MKFSKAFLLINVFLILANQKSQAAVTDVFSPNKIICVDSRNISAEMTITKDGKGGNVVAIQLLDLPVEPIIFDRAKFGPSPYLGNNFPGVVLHGWKSETGTNLTFGFAPSVNTVNPLFYSFGQNPFSSGDFKLSIADRRSTLTMECLPIESKSAILTKTNPLMALALVLRIKMALMSDTPSGVIHKLRNLDLNPPPIEDHWLAGEVKKITDLAKRMASIAPLPLSRDVETNKIHELNFSTTEFLKQQVGCDGVNPEGGLAPVYPVFCLRTHFRFIWK